MQTDSATKPIGLLIPIRGNEWSPASRWSAGGTRLLIPIRGNELQVALVPRHNNNVTNPYKG